MRRKSTIAAILAIFASTPALGQIGPGLKQPPVFESIDNNGVEIQTGKVVRAVQSISIGPGGPGSLSFDWSSDPARMNAIGGSITISQNAQDPTKDTAIVALSGSSETFSAPHGTTNFTQDQGRPSTLTYSSGTGNYIYTLSDGSVALFSKTLLAGSPQAYTWAVTSLTFPTGQVVNYYYVYRSPFYDLQAITSSLGYQLRFTRSAGNIVGAVAFNMNSETCDPQAASCTIVGLWPKLTWDQATSSIVDSSNRSVRWTLNSTQMQFVYPSGRTLTYTGTTDQFFNFKVGSFTDGLGTWTYQYPNQPFGGVSLIFNPQNAAPRSVAWSQTTGLVTSDMPVASQYPQFTYEYDAKSRLTKMKRNSGSAISETRYGYDSRGNLNEVRQVSSTPGTPLDIVTTAAFPATCGNPKTCNQPTSVTDSRGNVTDYTYDNSHGGVLTVTRPAPTANAVRPQFRYTYTSLSARYRNGSGTIVSGVPGYMVTGMSQCATLAGGSPPACANGPDEVKTVITYGQDDALLPLTTSSGSGNGSLSAVISMTYFPTGDVKTIDGPLPSSSDTTRNYYDAMRRPLGSIGPDPDGAAALLRRAVRISYDNDGRVNIREVGTATGQGDNDLTNMVSLQQDSTNYDAQGRIAVVETKTGSTTYRHIRRNYTNAGNLLCVAQRMDPAQWNNQSDACVPQTTAPNGPDRIARLSYDSFFRVLTVTAAEGTTEEVVEITNTFDAFGRLNTVKDGENNLTTYEYDGMNRLQKVRYPVPTKGANASSTSDYELLGYDPANNVTSRRNRANQTTSVTYDALNRATFKNLPGSEPDVTYAYDNLGRLTSASQTGTALSFTYDALSRNLTQTSPGGTICVDWDIASRRTRLRYPGAAACSDPFYVDYDYLVTGEMTKVRELGATSGAGVLATFTYDNLGRRVSLVRGNGTTTTYGYDQISQLASLTNDVSGAADDLTITNSNYNSAGQIVSQSRSNDAYARTGLINGTTKGCPDGLNRIASIGPSACPSAGASPTYDSNQNLTSDPQTSKNYLYSSQNLLRAASGSGYPAVTLVYDPMMRLQMSQEDTSGLATRWAYDGLEALTESDESSTLKRRFVWGPGINEPLVWYEGTGTSDRRWLHSDERGSIVAISNNSGTVTQKNRYDEFGLPQSGNAGRWQYTGQAWLPELNAYYYKARVYSPSLGRFLQTDPTGYQDGLNLYAYTKNDPANTIDPLGMIRVCWQVYNPPGPYASLTPSESRIIVTAYRSPVEHCTDIPETISYRASILGFATVPRILKSILDYILGPKADPRQPKRDKAISSICERRAHHNRMVDLSAAEMQAMGFDVAFNVGLRRFGDGKMAVADFIATLPGSDLYFLHEIKTGNAVLSPNQTEVYASGLLTVVGNNGLSLGLENGDLINVVYNGVTRFPGCNE